MGLFLDVVFYLRMSLFTLIFVGSGSVICTLCTISYLMLNLIAPGLHLIIAHTLYELLLSLITSCAELGISESQIFGEPSVVEILKTKRNLIVMNHKYEFDFALYLALADRVGCLRTMKCIIKKSLLFVPFLGFMCYMVDNIFIQRNWAQDCETIRSRLLAISSYDSVNLTLMPEGTRFSPEKRQQSLEHARTHGLPQLQHLLLPRPKGFLFATEFLRDKFDYLIDGLFLIPDHIDASLYNFVTRGNFKTQILLTAQPFADLPQDETSRKEVLYSSFVEKDKVMEQFNANGGTLEGIYTRIDCPVLTSRIWLRNIVNAFFVLVFYWCLGLALSNCHYFVFVGLSASCIGFNYSVALLVAVFHGFTRPSTP